MSKPKPLRLFLDSNVLTGGILAAWGLDKAVLALCAARICRMVLAEYVRDEVEENLLSRAAQFSPAEADQVIEDYGYSGSAGLVADPQHESFHASRGEANRVADCYPGRVLPRAGPGNFIVCRDEGGWIE